MKLVNKNGKRVDVHGKRLGKKQDAKKQWQSIGKSIGIFIVALVLLRTIIVITLPEYSSRVFIDIIDTPINFVIDPVAQIENYPLGILIWIWT